jgi:hypothetical protein
VVRRRKLEMLACLVVRAVAVLVRLLEVVRLAQEILQALLHLKEITVVQRVLELLEVLAAVVLVR